MVRPISKLSTKLNTKQDRGRTTVAVERRLRSNDGRGRTTARFTVERGRGRTVAELAVERWLGSRLNDTRTH